MNTFKINHKKLSYLGDRVKLQTATKQEKDEFMTMLYQNGNITQKQYQEYNTNKNVDDLVNVGLAVGAILLIGSLIKELVPSK